MSSRPPHNVSSPRPIKGSRFMAANVHVIQRETRVGKRAPEMKTTFSREAEQEASQVNTTEGTTAVCACSLFIC